MTLRPTPERMRHGEIVEVPAIEAPAGTFANRVVDTLEWYFKRELLAPGQKAENARRYIAGTKLREAWDYAGLDSLPVGGMVAVDGTRDPERRLVAAIDKSAEFSRMLAYVGTACEWAVMGVCIRGEDVGRGGPMDRLRLGLAQLANALRIP